MKIMHEDEINSAAVVALRQASGLGPSAFWRAVRVTPQSGRNYENGRRIPPTVRRLLMLEYVAGLPTGMDIESAQALAAIITAGRSALRANGRIELATHSIGVALRNFT